MSHSLRQLPSFITRQDCDSRISEAGVQLWKAWLGDEDEAASMTGVLSPDEAERAARFVFAQHRRRFMAARGALRSVLGECLGESPAALAFVYGPHGKPAIGAEWQDSGIEFNLAHSGDWAVVAVCCGRRVGIDVEQMRRDVSGPEIARRYFSPREVEALESLPLQAREEAFFRCWTRKEAYLKALGCGLSVGLESFDVSLAPDVAPALLATCADPLPPDKWQMAELRPAPGYVGAIIVEAG